MKNWKLDADFETDLVYFENDERSAREIVLDFLAARKEQTGLRFQLVRFYRNDFLDRYEAMIHIEDDCILHEIDLYEEEVDEIDEEEDAWMPRCAAPGCSAVEMVGDQQCYGCEFFSEK